MADDLKVVIQMSLYLKTYLLGIREQSDLHNVPNGTKQTFVAARRILRYRHAQLELMPSGL